MSYTRPAVYVISLDREVERRKALEQQLAEHAIDYQHVRGVDGRALDLDSVPGLDQAAARRLLGRRLLPGELGCYLSHRRLWVQLLEQEVGSAVVLESDARLGADFVAVIDALEAADLNWEIAMLCYSKLVPSFWGRHRLLPGTQVVKFANRRAFYTTGYMLKRRANEVLYAQSEAITMPIDHLISGGRVDKHLEMIAITPECVRPASLETEAGSIHEERVAGGVAGRPRKQRGPIRRATYRAKLLARQLAKPRPSL